MNTAENNPLLAQLQGTRTCVMYKLIPQADGSLDKVPINPYTGFPSNPHEPSEWLTPEEAVMWSEQYGREYGVGVVISEQIVLKNGLRLFCLDLDKCRDGNQWLPHAASFCARFPGALLECSVSGNGLHVFGCYAGDRPDHGVKNRTYGMELYTRLRFIATTGALAQGSALVDHTKALHQLAVEFFPPRDEVEYNDTLTDKPVPEWSGSDDDDEMLRRMMRSTSSRQVFGGKAAFADLFNGNADVLSRVFPPFKNTPWDYSAAELALANHCAFWLGNNGERMLKIMRRSALVRDKWERPGYIIHTINLACASQKQWYKDPRAQNTTAGPPVPAVPIPPINAAPMPFAPLEVPTVPGARPEIGKYLTLQEQLHLFAGCVYVQDIHEISMPDGRSLSADRFDVEFAGYNFAVRADGQAPAKRAWDAFVHSQIYTFPRVRGLFFDPRRPPREIMVREGWTYLNAWVPVSVPRIKGDASPFVNHVRKLLPNGNDAEILISYFAACVQYPGYKFQYWPLIQGVEGNGKTFLSRLLEKSIGARHTHWPKASELGSKFNAPFYNKLLVLVEDVKISEQKESLWETLKPMITGEQLEIEAKGVDKVMREVCFNGVLNTNHKNGIRKTRNDRRICPFFCAQQKESDLERDGLTEDYFIEFKRWVFEEGGPIVAEFLATYPIQDKWNPAKRSIRAPLTSATEEAINAGLGSIEQEVLEATYQGLAGFRGGWVNSMYLDRFLAGMGRATIIPRNRRQDLLESIGFRPHPALPNGRSFVVDADGSRPILYVRPDAPGALETDPMRVMQWYQYCQNQPTEAPRHATAPA